MKNPASSRIDVQPISHELPSASVAVLRLRAADPSALTWRAGQYLELFIEPGAAGVPFSIASAPLPERPGEFELAISTQGNLDLLARAESSRRLQVSAPRGEFVWRPNARGSLFVGMGTGLSPLRAMLQAARREAPQAPSRLLFGARGVADLLWKAEFESWAAQGSFVFAPTLSQAVSDWSGRRGRVQAHLAELARDSAGFSAYVCGSRGMVADCVEALTGELGFERSLVFCEAH
ncbi:MAG: hypothetical protein QM756_32405 [Polyangiaceae bacterium]